MLLSLTLILSAATPYKIVGNDWTHSGLDAVFAATLETRFVDLLLANGVQVTSPRDVAAVVGLERQKQLLGCTNNTSCLSEIGGALGVDAILFGSVVRAGKGFTVTLRLIATKDARALVSASGRVKSEDLLQDWLDEKARTMSAALRKALPREPEVVKPPPPPEPQTVLPPPLPSTVTGVAAEAPSTYPLRRLLVVPLAAVGVGIAAGVYGFLRASASLSAEHDALKSAGQVTDQALGFASTGRTMQIIGWCGAGLTAAGIATTLFFAFFNSPPPVTVGLWLQPGAAQLAFQVSLP